jgi:hypothetical protein
MVHIPGDSCSRCCSSTRKWALVAALQASLLAAADAAAPSCSCLPLSLSLLLLLHLPCIYMKKPWRLLLLHILCMVT